MFIEDAQQQSNDCVIHFSISMKNAWDNVIHSRSTLLLFRDVYIVKGRCDRYDMPVSDIRQIDHIWQLYKRWYGFHSDEDW